MKTTDLRVGNLIKSGNGIYKIFALSIPQILAIQDYRETIDSQKKVFETGNTIIKPIPLTEEWLKKFGFEYINNLWVNGTIGISLNNISGQVYNRILVNKKNNIYADWCSLQTIYFVHQLQNLYFGLNRKELKEAKPSKSSNGNK